MAVPGLKTGWHGLCTISGMTANHTLTPAALLAALEARRAAIQAAWLAARPAVGSPEAAMWLAAYSVATGRCARAFVWLR